MWLTFTDYCAILYTSGVAGGAQNGELSDIGSSVIRIRNPGFQSNGAVKGFVRMTLQIGQLWPQVPFM